MRPWMSHLPRRIAIRLQKSQNLESCVKIVLTYPPVDVPPIRSKHSQGLGRVRRLPSTINKCINRRMIRRLVSPLVPPPSVEISIFSRYSRAKCTNRVIVSVSAVGRLDWFRSDRPWFRSAEGYEMVTTKQRLSSIPVTGRSLRCPGCIMCVNPSPVGVGVDVGVDVGVAHTLTAHIHLPHPTCRSASHRPSPRLTQTANITSYRHPDPPIVLWQPP